MNNRFQETLQLMKERWPAIGEHADHPMGPWFLERRNERPWRRRYRPRNQMSVFWLIPLSVIFNIFAPIIFLVIYLIRRAYNRGAKDLAQPVSFFVGRNRANLNELWLSGISGPEMAAVEIALALSDPWLKLIWWPSLIIWNIIPAIVIAFCCYIQSHEEMISPLAWSCILTGAAFWFILFFALNNANRTVKKAMKDFLDDVQDRCRGKIKQLLFGFQRVALGCISLNILFMIMVEIFSFEHGFEYGMLIIFGSGILFTPYYVIKLQPSATENYFKERSAKLQEQFATIIRAESERDLALHRKASQ